MKNFQLKHALIVAVVAGSLGAVSVRAGDIDVAGTPGTQPPSLAPRDTGNGARLGSDLIAGYRAPQSAAIAEGMDDPGLDEGNPQKLNEDIEDLHSMGLVPADGEDALLPPFALRHVNVDLSGADSSEAVPNMALGPQYALNSNVTLGGTWEGHDTIALSARSDDEKYTFGLRVVF